MVLSSLLALSLAPVCAAPCAAQAVAHGRVTEDILGVRIGSTLEEARMLLDALGSRDGRETRDGGRKEAVALKASRYHSVAFRSDNTGRVVWITGFVRSGAEIPFEELGDRSIATRWGASAATWDPPGPVRYRVMAKGSAGKASVVTLLLVLPGGANAS